MAPAEPSKKRNRLLSPITRRILAVNILALVVLFAGMLFLDNYRRGLISAELAALQTQTELIAAALGESAADAELPAGEALNPTLAQQMIRRLVETTGTRARLFGIDGSLLADSRMLAGPGGMVQITELPVPKTTTEPLEAVLGLYDLVATRLSTGSELVPYSEYAVQTAADYQEVVHALSGGVKEMVRAAPGADAMVLSAAAPVQRYKQVLGALMLNKTSRDIDAAVLDVRLDILKVFARRARRHRAAVPVSGADHRAGPSSAWPPPPRASAATATASAPCPTSATAATRSASWRRRSRR